MSARPRPRAPVGETSGGRYIRNTEYVGLSRPASSSTPKKPMYPALYAFDEARGRLVRRTADTPLMEAGVDSLGRARGGAWRDERVCSSFSLLRQLKIDGMLRLRHTDARKGRPHDTTTKGCPIRFHISILGGWTGCEGSGGGSEALPAPQLPCKGGSGL